MLKNKHCKQKHLTQWQAKSILYVVKQIKNQVRTMLQTIRTILLVVLALFSTNSETMAKNTIIKIPGYYNESACSNAYSGVSEDTIIKRVLCDNSIQDALKEFQHDAHYDSWKIATEESGQHDGWVVRIKSQGRIPSSSCLIKLDTAGNITFKECSYNK